MSSLYPLSQHAYLPTYLPSYLPSFLPTYLPTYLFLPSHLPYFLPPNLQCGEAKGDRTQPASQLVVVLGDLLTQHRHRKHVVAMGVC